MARIRLRTACQYAAAAALACAAAAIGAVAWSHAHAVSAAAAAAAVGGVGALLALGGGALAWVGARSEDDRAARRGQLQQLLRESGSHEESRQLLLAELARAVPRAGAVVLSRIAGEDKLEPAYGRHSAETPLRGLPLGRPAASTCVAAVVGHPRRQAADADAAAAPAPPCALCGRLAGELLCEPLRVGRRTYGSVLLAADEPLRDGERERLLDAIEACAPVLTLQRSLEAADRHAAFDPLTELPNRRAAELSLRRLSAQAGRTISPLAAVLVDLDRVAEINARSGHDSGDRALQTVARTLTVGVRASDLVARLGGGAFLVLAPDTDRRGAADLAEKLRAAIESLPVPGVGRVTASLGVAALPEDAAGPDGLTRAAERALASAKALGRNRVHAQPAEG